MSDAHFFKGTSSDQDSRFGDKKKKLMKTMKFADGLETKVDMGKVNMATIKPWINQRITELLSFEDDVIIGFIYNQLEEKFPDGRDMQINMTGFLNAKNARTFVQDLWALLISAQDNIGGIPAVFVEQKKEEIKKRQAEVDKAREIMEKEAAAAEEKNKSKHREKERDRCRDKERVRSPDSRSPSRRRKVKSRFRDRTPSNSPKPYLSRSTSRSPRPVLLGETKTAVVKPDDVVTKSSQIADSGNEALASLASQKIAEVVTHSKEVQEATVTANGSEKAAAIADVEGVRKSVDDDNCATVKDSDEITSVVDRDVNVSVVNDAPRDKKRPVAKENKNSSISRSRHEISRSSSSDGDRSHSGQRSKVAKTTRRTSKSPRKQHKSGSLQRSHHRSISRGRGGRSRSCRKSPARGGDSKSPRRRTRGRRSPSPRRPRHQSSPRRRGWSPRRREGSPGRRERGGRSSCKKEGSNVDSARRRSKKVSGSETKKDFQSESLKKDGMQKRKRSVSGSTASDLSESQDSPEKKKTMQQRRNYRSAPGSKDPTSSSSVSPPQVKAKVAIKRVGGKSSSADGEGTVRRITSSTTDRKVKHDNRDKHEDRVKYQDRGKHQDRDKDRTRDRNTKNASRRHSSSPPPRRRTPTPPPPRRRRSPSPQLSRRRSPPASRRSITPSRKRNRRDASPAKRQHRSRSPRSGARPARESSPARHRLRTKSSSVSPLHLSKSRRRGDSKTPVVEERRIVRAPKSKPSNSPTVESNSSSSDESSEPVEKNHSEKLLRKNLSISVTKKRPTSSSYCGSSSDEKEEVKREVVKRVNEKSLPIKSVSEKKTVESSPQSRGLGRQRAKTPPPSPLRRHRDENDPPNRRRKSRSSSPVDVQRKRTKSPCKTSRAQSISPASKRLSPSSPLMNVRKATESTLNLPTTPLPSIEKRRVAGNDGKSGTTSGALQSTAKSGPTKGKRPRSSSSSSSSSSGSDDESESSSSAESATPPVKRVQTTGRKSETSAMMISSSPERANRKNSVRGNENRKQPSTPDRRRAFNESPGLRTRVSGRGLQMQDRGDRRRASTPTSQGNKSRNKVTDWKNRDPSPAARSQDQRHDTLDKARKISIDSLPVRKKESESPNRMNVERCTEEKRTVSSQMTVHTAPVYNRKSFQVDEEATRIDSRKKRTTSLRSPPQAVANKHALTDKQIPPSVGQKKRKVSSSSSSSDSEQSESSSNSSDDSGKSSAQEVHTNKDVQLRKVVVVPFNSNPRRRSTRSRSQSTEHGSKKSHPMPKEKQAASSTGKRSPPSREAKKVAKVIPIMKKNAGDQSSSSESSSSSSSLSEMKTPPPTRLRRTTPLPVNIKPAQSPERKRVPAPVRADRHKLTESKTQSKSSEPDKMDVHNKSKGRSSYSTNVRDSLRGREDIDRSIDMDPRKRRDRAQKSKGENSPYNAEQERARENKRRDRNSVSASMSPKRRPSPKNSRRQTVSPSSSSNVQGSHSESPNTPVRHTGTKRECIAQNPKRESGKVLNVRTEEVKRRDSSDGKLGKFSGQDTFRNASKKRKLIDDEESGDSMKKEKKIKKQKEHKHNKHKKCKEDDGEEENVIRRVGRSNSLEELEAQLREKALRSLQESKLSCVTSVRREKRSDDED